MGSLRGAAPCCRARSWLVASPDAAAATPRWRWVPPGQDQARRRNHIPGEVEPRGRTLIRDVEQPRTAGHPQAQEHPGQIPGEGGAASLVVDKPQRPAPGRQAQHHLDHVGPMRPANPGSAHHGRPWLDRPDFEFARPACCGRRPSAGWAGPTRCTARTRRRQRRSRWTPTPGGRRSRQPPRPRTGRRGRCPSTPGRGSIRRRPPQSTPPHGRPGGDAGS